VGFFRMWKRGDVCWVQPTEVQSIERRIPLNKFPSPRTTKMCCRRGYSVFEMQSSLFILSSGCVPRCTDLVRLTERFNQAIALFY